MYKPDTITKTHKRAALFALGQLFMMSFIFVKPVLADGPDLDAIEDDVGSWRSAGVRLAQIALGFYLIFYIFKMVDGNRSGSLKSAVLIIVLLIVLESFEQLFANVLV